LDEDDNGDATVAGGGGGCCWCDDEDGDDDMGIRMKGDNDESGRQTMPEMNVVVLFWLDPGAESCTIWMTID
jgi:hypothetical protein